LKEQSSTSDIASSHKHLLLDDEKIQAPRIHLNWSRCDAEPLLPAASVGAVTVLAPPPKTSLKVEVTTDAVARNMLRNTQGLLRLICKYGNEGRTPARYIQVQSTVIVRAVFAYLHLSSHTFDDHEQYSLSNDYLIKSVKNEVYDRWNAAYIQVAGYMYRETQLTPRNGLHVLMDCHTYQNFMESVEPQVRGYAEAIMDCSVDEDNESDKPRYGRVVFGQSQRYVELADELDRRMRMAMVFRHTRIAPEGNYRRHVDDLGGRTERFISPGGCFSCLLENCTNLVNIAIFRDTDMLKV
jgi:hypothetical protein